MKHELIIISRNLARFIPITFITCLFTHIATRSWVWPTVVFGTFIVFCGLSTVADIRYRNALKTIMHGDGHGKH